MEDWHRNRLLLEVGLLVLLVGGAGLGLKRIRRQAVTGATGKGWWVPWVVLAVATPFIRRWLLDMDWVEAPAETLADGVRALPESVGDLDAINDWLYDVIVPLGVPGGFLIGYIFKTATVATGKVLFRLPLAVGGVLGLGLVYQFTVAEASDLSEAVMGLWETVRGLWEA